ncbi:hypothetical protein [Streptomyces sp. 8N706]|uniref:hypothetical protein n=1 Tax=Streptomyces sp. 8N706 TaxID=3457416 RepID=UPI003FD5EEB5
MTWQQGLCNGHGIRWCFRGRPPMEDFLAAPGRPVRDRGELAACAADGCRFGVTAHNSLEAVACFSRFLAHAGIDRLVDVDRPLLERHLA